MWDLHATGWWAAVPTNKQVRADGTAVMGAGLALDAANRFPGLSARYGSALVRGDVNVGFTDIRVLCVPTKDHWRDPSTVELVSAALQALARWCVAHPDERLVVPALGCGLGGLAFETVAEMTAETLGVFTVTLIPPLPPTAR